MEGKKVMRKHLLLWVLIGAVLLGCHSTMAEVHRISSDHAVALIGSTFSCGCSRWGTGVMISRYAMLSARHNFYCPVHGSKMAECSFYFGYEHGGQYYHLEKVSASGSSGETHKFNSKEDISFFVFDEPVGDLTGWHEYEVCTKNELKGKTGSIVNYDWVHRLQADSFPIQATSDTRVKWNDVITTDHWEGGPLVVDDKVVGVYEGNNGEASYFCLLDNNIIQQLQARNAFDQTGGTPPERNGKDGESEEEQQADSDETEVEEEETIPETTDGEWICQNCGQEGNTGNFCSNCAEPRPQPEPDDTTWICPNCGQEGNTGNFCGNCGTARPEESAADGVWTCPACGQDENTGNFCSNCGTSKP